MFLDDGIGGNRDYETAVRSSRCVQNTIKSFGFLFADEKCQWQPTRNVVWLGHVIDMNKNLLFITEERIRILEIKIKSLVLQIRLDKCGIVPVRFLASVAGQIISMQSVIGNKVRLYTRELFKCINARASWNAPVRVSEQAVGELLYWKEKARSLNEKGKDLKYFPKSDFVLYVDASATGYGSFLEQDNLSSYACFVNDNTCFPEAESEGKCNSVNVTIKKTLAFPEEKVCVPPEVEREMIRMSPEVDSVRKNSFPEVELEGKCNSENVTIKEILAFPEEKVCVPPEVDRKIIRMFPEADIVKKNSCPEAHTVKKVDSINKKCLKFPCREIIGDWSLEEQNKSSTWRESEAVYRSMRTFASTLKNSHVTVYSDNKNVKSVLLNGSRKANIQSISIDFNNICQRENIKVNQEWIPRESNTRADFLSRCTDSDGWEICDDIFHTFDLKWGRYTIDRFASNLNNKCKRFNSRWWVPGTEAVDALSQNWSHDINWIVPPPRLVMKCLVKTLEEKANCTYILPKWTSAQYWPLLIDNRGNFKCFIKQYINLSRSHVVKMGNENHGLFSRSPLAFDMIALNIDV
ncbi:uncharacterized protein LOC123555791 isoform X1 [Mercenaria mercenaria]|uniref:uncharacterized protein LOC123555791 isoform X1 n=1 Tax=Mercenaria mercenaria TaxID=6596 RepID=UPI00234F269C|nr:uncharacterized protein LOC123555791 isoform X1 [Mercenaria mercenaria]